MADLPTQTNATGVKGVDIGGQSIVVAVASALALFTVVGLIISRAAGIAPMTLASDPVSSLTVSLPVAEAQALSPAAYQVRAPQMPSAGASGSMQITVPARVPVVLDVGAPVHTQGGTQDVAVMIPPLEPGHHLLTIGQHQVLVTAVER